MKTGLVMEGGAMRGLFTAGVTDVLMENNIVFDGAVGVSAGAAFGCNVKSGQIGRALRYNKRFCRDKRYCSIRSLIFTGDLYGAEFCYHVVPETLDIFDREAYDKNPMEFHVVCTDVETGKPIYKNWQTSEDPFIEWLRASASMPLASRIVEIDGYKMLDGGISDSIPIKYFESVGYDRNIVILTQPKGYVKKKNSLIPFIKIALRKYPKVVEALENRHNVYNETIKYICEKEEKGEIFVIRPEDMLPIGHVEHDGDKIEAVYQLGRAAALKHLEEIKRFLAYEK